DLRDPVVLFETEHELAVQLPAEVVGGVKLKETEAKGRGLVPGDEKEFCLDVVRPAELVAFVQRQLPARAWGHPVLDRGYEDDQVVVDRDRDGRIRTLGRGRPGEHLERRHAAAVPEPWRGQT